MLVNPSKPVEPGGQSTAERSNPADSVPARIECAVVASRATSSLLLDDPHFVLPPSLPFPNCKLERIAWYRPVRPGLESELQLWRWQCQRGEPRKRKKGMKEQKKAVRLSLGRRGERGCSSNPVRDEMVGGVRAGRGRGGGERGGLIAFEGTIYGLG